MSKYLDTQVVLLLHNLAILHIKQGQCFYLAPIAEQMSDWIDP